MDLECICKNYYQKFYTAGTKVNECTMIQVLSYVLDKLSSEMKNSLRAPLTMAELQTNLMLMKLDKALGPNGIIMEFYQCFLDLLISRKYLTMLKEGI